MVIASCVNFLSEVLNEGFPVSGVGASSRSATGVFAVCNFIRTGAGAGSFFLVLAGDFRFRIRTRYMRKATSSVRASELAITGEVSLIKAVLGRCVSALPRGSVSARAGSGYLRPVIAVRLGCVLGLW